MLQILNYLNHRYYLQSGVLNIQHYPSHNTYHTLHALTWFVVLLYWTWRGGGWKRWVGRQEPLWQHHQYYGRVLGGPTTLALPRAFSGEKPKSATPERLKFSSYTRCINMSTHFPPKKKRWRFLYMYRCCRRWMELHHKIYSGVGGTGPEGLGNPPDHTPGMQSLVIS